MAKKKKIKNEITSFLHCKECLEALGDHGTYIQYMECGFTPQGFQVWCRGCDKNMIHIDFLGQNVGTV